MEDVLQKTIHKEKQRLRIQYSALDDRRPSVKSKMISKEIRLA